MNGTVRSLTMLLLGAILAGCGQTAATPTRVPTQTPFSVAGVIHPGEKIAEMTIDGGESKHYFALMDACNFDWSFSSPTSQTVQCTFPELTTAGVGPFWGAATTEFEANWAEMTWELYIDDYQVVLDEFGTSDIAYFDPSAGFEVTYRHWNVLLKNLTPGKHTIREVFVINIDIFDGWTTYTAGRYELLADLTVTETAYSALPQAPEAGQHAYTSTSGAVDFLLYVPASYGADSTRQWPLLIFLHDAELRGTTPDILLSDVFPQRLNTLSDFPFLVLTPVGDGDWEFWSNEMEAPLLDLIEEVRSLYAVDEKRIYLTGAGMGGNGTWALGLQHPEIFAALVPLGGYTYPFGVPEDICALKDVPVWAFHGGNDFMVPPEVERALVDALNACGGSAQLTVRPEAVIPLEEYFNAEMFDWLLEQNKE